ncbi:MAG TPA: heme-binding protein [Methylomirabilota bacterium]|nr:heme-binding protein [Methylomirabilota bacterium]
MRWLQRVLAALVITAAGTAEAQVATQHQLTIEGARQVIAAAAAEAKKNRAGGVIAVVDAGGNLMALERLDGTFAAGANISIGKARTAALFKRPTKFFEDVIKNGRTSMVALNDFTPLQGGVPIMVGDEVVGAVGVSGAASAQQDEEVAMAGAAAARSFGAKAADAPITYFDHARVAAGFAKGMPLLETAGYAVHASRREGPGMAEVHDWETDVLYVLEGSATVITGGTVVDPKVTEPGQVRGVRIQGGESRRIARGDVMVIPAGVPHWFADVQGPLTYFVVKPISRN